MPHWHTTGTSVHNEHTVRERLRQAPPVRRRRASPAPPSPSRAACRRSPCCSKIRREKTAPQLRRSKIRARQMKHLYIIALQCITLNKLNRSIQCTAHGSPYAWGLMNNTICTVYGWPWNYTLEPTVPIWRLEFNLLNSGRFDGMGSNRGEHCLRHCVALPRRPRAPRRDSRQRQAGGARDPQRLLERRGRGVVADVVQLDGLQRHRVVAPRVEIESNI